MFRLLKHAILPALLIAFAASASAQQTTKICVQGTNSANNGNSCTPVDSSHPFPVGAGGYEFNIATRPTVQNAQYTAGESLGGLFTMTIGTTTSITGILDQISLAFAGGSTAGQVVYVWDANPTNTTCTDRVNFVGSGTDNLHLITGAPVSLIPALVASAQDTRTYASVGNLTDNFVATGASTLWACDLMNTTATPASTTDFIFRLQGIKDAP